MKIRNNICVSLLQIGVMYITNCTKRVRKNVRNVQFLPISSTFSFLLSREGIQPRPWRSYAKVSSTRQRVGFVAFIGYRVVF